MAIVGIDYFYITHGGVRRRDELEIAQDESGEKELHEKRLNGEIVKCLVIRCSLTKAVFGHVVPCKGIDEDGYVFFKSRDDDVITSGGYRIGPGEIEECLMRHPAVAMVGVVGVPDRVRTEIVKAFVQLRPEIVGTEALKAELAGYVKTRLAAHEYPREVEFVAELPLTTTGKIMRRELRRMDAERKRR